MKTLVFNIFSPLVLININYIYPAVECSIFSNALMSGMRNIDWYHSLKQPVFSPPDWVFAPVWSVLYVLIFLSLLLFLKEGSLKDKIIPLTFFAIQIVLNFLWSPVFFGMKKIGAALIICFLLWIFVLAVIISFYGHSKPATLLLVPYFLWSSFALYLNFELWRLNRAA